MDRTSKAMVPTCAKARDRETSRWVCRQDNYHLAGGSDVRSGLSQTQCPFEQRCPAYPATVVTPMVESNQEEERLVRIEQTLERLSREAADTKALTAKLVKAVAVLTPKNLAATRRKA